MEKEFTSYELALKLKKMGLSKFEMFGWYINEDGTQFSKSFHKVDSRSFHFNFKYCTKAPLWQQIEEGFLKEHKLYGIVIPTITMHWTYKITTVTEDMVEAPPYKCVNGTDYSTREEAREAMVKEMITMVENR